MTQDTEFDQIKKLKQYMNYVINECEKISVILHRHDAFLFIIHGAIFDL